MWTNTNPETEMKEIMEVRQFISCNLVILCNDINFQLNTGKNYRQYPRLQGKLSLESAGKLAENMNIISVNQELVKQSSQNVAFLEIIFFAQKFLEFEGCMAFFLIVHI